MNLGKTVLVLWICLDNGGFFNALIIFKITENNLYIRNIKR